MAHKALLVLGTRNFKLLALQERALAQRGNLSLGYLGIVKGQVRYLRQEGGDLMAFTPGKPKLLLLSNLSHACLLYL